MEIERNNCMKIDVKRDSVSEYSDSWNVKSPESGFDKCICSGNFYIYSLSKNL